MNATGRENEQEAVDRMFNPSGRIAVLPTDWERLFRVNLGIRARGWLIRCWSHPERSLVSHELWPLATDETALEIRGAFKRRIEELYQSGPETILVAVGPKDRIITDSELDWARGLMEGIVRRQQTRIPLIKKVIVMRFWPLELIVQGDRPDIPLPCFDLDMMDGRLRTIGSNKMEPIPNKRLLLNAAVVDIDMENILPQWCK